MKKTIALTLSMVLILVSLSCVVQAEEGPRFVTIQEWLDAKGECGDCMLLLKVTQILNPVLAVAADEFMSQESGPKVGYVLVIANPKYNEYEGNIEMAAWTLLRMLPVIE